MAHLKYFKKYNTFCSLMKDTKKYEEFHKENSVKWSIVLSVIFSVLLIFIFKDSPDLFITKINTLIGLLLPALIGLLGFYIAGLAIMASLIDLKIIRVLESQSKMENLAGILFCYYFAGALVLATIIDFIFCYLCFIINIAMPIFFIEFLITLSCFLFIFSICYTVALLGTCINFFFLMFYLQNDEDKDTSNHDDCI